MRINLNPLTIFVSLLLCIIAMSATNKENAFSNYSAIYTDNEYVILKKNVYGNITRFSPKPEHGKLIRDSVAEAEIKLYREKNPTATRYIDFNFNNVLGYISSFQNVEDPAGNASLGVRIYPAIDLETKQLTVIISPTRNDRSLWKNKSLMNGRVGGDKDDVEAFNTGSLCPLNCPDGDTTNIPK